MKTCFVCNISKPLVDFYAHKGMKDGHLGRCKSCCSSFAKQHRLKHAERIRAYDRERGNRQSPDYTPMYRKDNPEKYKATNKVNNALRDGRLFKWPVCSLPECDATRVVGHHVDYNSPLDVIWLCQAHHKQLHSETL